MNRNEAEQVLHCAMSIGEQMLTSGAEVRRVEDTIRRICMAYGATRVDVFSITSSIVTTMFGEGFDSCTQSRRVAGYSNNFDKLDRLNQLSRRICKELPSPNCVMSEIETIGNGPRYAFWAQVFIYAITSGAFSVFFGGDWMDMIVSACIGILLKFTESSVKQHSTNSLFPTLVCSIFGGLLANLSVRFGLGHHADLISIGNIMLFIPGVMFTNSLRDMFTGDMITGLIRFAESVLVAVIVALGFIIGNFVI